MKTPISLIIDDPAPVISVYYEHCGSLTTRDGRPLIPTYPNALLHQFCAIVKEQGLKGKFSVIPMPGNKGDILHGLEGTDPKDVQEWLDTVKEKIVGPFTIGPEMLTHHKAVDLETGEALPMNEQQFAATKDRTALTPYIAKALSLLKEAGFSPIGVTSPWQFGIEVEAEYEASISRAVYDVTGEKNAWFFLRSLRNRENARPWVALKEEGRTLVSIPATMTDHFWQTIDCPDTSDAYVSAIADEIITEDGKSGELIDVLNNGGWPILITHWQSLMSNGLGTGLRALSEVGRRIKKHLADQVEWMNFEEILSLVAENPEAFPKPIF